MINFKESADKIFNPFVEHYDFKVHKSDNSVSLVNNSVSIDIYFEDYFEVNTYLRFLDANKKQDVNLISLSKYLNLDKDTVSFISSNQINSNSYLIRYLQCVRKILIFVSELVENDKEKLNKYLDKYFQDILEYKENQQRNVLFSLLNTLWHNKKYDDYSSCLKKNSELLSVDKNYSLAHRRLLYIEKHCSKR